MKNTAMVLNLIVALTFVACTQSRKAELPADVQSDILAISEFNGSFQASRDSAETAATSTSMKALEQTQNSRLSAENVNVPERLKFMFSDLPVSSQTASQFEIKFLVDKKYVTAFKVVSSARELTAIEKSLAMTSDEVALIQKSLRSSATELKVLTQSLSKASDEKTLIKMGKKDGTLLIPILKYEIADYGVLERTKNELKEETAVLKLTKTEFKNATHIQLKSLTDGRTTIGKTKDLEELFVESKLDNQLMTASQLESNLNIGMRFIDDSTQVFSRLDVSVLHIYEVTVLAKLNENQARLLKNQAGNQEVIACSDESVKNYIQSTDKDCVLILKADLPITYNKVELVKANEDGSTSGEFELKQVPRSQSVGLVQILKNTPAKQVDISGTLDPNSAVKIADLKGEFFYRRTFEAASNMFLGRTGTSGDMSIVQFELEDSRLVVRNQQSLIQFTGQGPKDREEIMSFPVKYIRMNKISADGATLTVPVAEVTTKEKAEYAIIDWTQNTVPNASSPLAFYADGSCFLANSSQQVTDTDMRLATDGVLNLSLSGSYTMQPRNECIAMKDVNSAYWGGSYQFNYNIVERISFKKHSDKNSDVQFAMNISSMAQEAFNFGTFGLADKLTENGTLLNRDGSEKYMPIINDFRNGKKIKYYVGGLNTAATDSERRELIVEGTKQVVKEWNSTLRYAFRGTTLERSGDYVDLVVDDGSAEPIGHLGDLDRNYIWYQELPAENGLLGVAQPAANPRSGTIESANVIIYSGNTLDQTVRMLKSTQVSRNYEKAINDMRKNAFEKAKKTQALVSTKDEVEAAAAAAAMASGKTNKVGTDRIDMRTISVAKDLKQAIAALQLDSRVAQSLIENKKMKKSGVSFKKTLNKDLFKDASKGEKINYEVNQMTFLKKITELSMNNDLLQNPHEFELAVNNAFIKFGGMDEASKAVLQKKSEQLAMAVRFDNNNKSRPGCFKYARTDINDEALTLDKDPRKNLMLNFKKNIMSTLSHELGHAFGLLHNFKASTDKENYEFSGEKTGRNYSSIMDYIADIDQNYQGPGPYDAHALRAAYTGLVEVSGQAIPSLQAKGAQIVNNNLVSIDNLMKAMGKTSLVHFTKDTLNTTGLIKYYAQCSDGGLSQHAMCAQFDVGGSATEIVKNKIADYNRSYISRNYVYDKIIFNWPQKVEAMNRNISLFQSIRRYLDEAVNSEFYGAGRTAAVNRQVTNDQINAAGMGYQFFHELIRTPDAAGISASDYAKRFYAIPYQYVGTQALDTDTVKCKANDKNQFICDDIKILEARSLYDKALNLDKIDTLGIGYDKIFAMQFLLQSSSAPRTDDNGTSLISYLDFEQWFMGIDDPSMSPTINTMLQIMSNDLRAGFFAPNTALIETDIPIEINQYLGDQTAVSSVISLAESKWKGFDPFAESFKIGSAFVKNAPKDRLNIAKAGQDRQKSDTRVMYATQNAVGSDVMIRIANRTEILISNQQELFKMMADLYQSDLASTTKNADSAKNKAIADEFAAKLVAKLRELNSKEGLMSKSLDAPEAAMNYVRQVEILRVLMVKEIGLITEILTVLKTTPVEQINGTIQQFSQTIQQLKATNKKLESTPLLSLGQTFMTGAVSQMKIKMLSGAEITGVMVAEKMMNGRKLQQSQDKLLEVLANLSTYSNIVDADTYIK